jgi:hypothetical protein
MERKVLVKKLISEGFSSELLSTFSDKNLLSLSERILSEDTLNIPKDDNQSIEDAKRNDQKFVTYEEDVNEEDEETCECDKKNLKEWVEGVVKSNTTTKSEIMEMIGEKLTELEDIEIDEQEIVEPTTKPITKPTTRPKRDTPFRPKPGINPKPKAKKGHNGIPEFMTYDEIKGKK